MAVKIRLTRLGDKKSPFYRVVVADARVARDGKYIEQIGTYNPLTTPAEIKINAELANKWLKNGAQPTETAKALLQTAGVLEVKGNSVAKTNNKKKLFENKRFLKIFSLVVAIIAWFLVIFFVSPETDDTIYDVS